MPDHLLRYCPATWPPEWQVAGDRCGTGSLQASAGRRLRPGSAADGWECWTRGGCPLWRRSPLCCTTVRGPLLPPPTSPAYAGARMQSLVADRCDFLPQLSSWCEHPLASGKQQPSQQQHLGDTDILQGKSHHAGKREESSGQRIRLFAVGTCRQLPGSSHGLQQHRGC